MSGFKTLRRNFWLIGCFCFLSLGFRLTLSSLCYAESERKLNLEEFKQDQVGAYKNQDWEHFFGAAQAYRKFWWKKNPSVDLVFFEIVGLVKICRFSDALHILQALEPYLDSTKDRNLGSRLKSLIQSFEAQKTTLPVLTKIPKFHTQTRQTVFWSINQGASQVLPLKNFVLKLDSLCQ